MERLNEIAANAFPPTRRWTEMEIRSYVVVEIRKVNTRFGKRMVFVINDDAAAEGGFQIFLPTRVSNMLYKDDEMYNYLIAKANKLELSIMHNGNG